MAFVKTSVEKDKILKNDKNKLREEISAKQKELGLRTMVPRHNQDEYTQLADLDYEKNNIKDSMAFAKEQRIKKNEAIKKAKRKSFKENLKLYFAQRERKAKQAYDKRRIIFLNGGFEDYEDTIEMMSYRVLLKEIKENNSNSLIVKPDNFKEKFAKYRVIKKGNYCDDINEGDIVIVEAYSGIEIVSKQNVYRIVTIDDVICKEESDEYIDSSYFETL